MDYFQGLKLLNCRRQMLTISWTMKITNQQILRRIQLKTADIRKKKIGYFGHINYHEARIDYSRDQSASRQDTSLLVHGKIEGKCSRDRPRSVWMGKLPGVRILFSPGHQNALMCLRLFDPQNISFCFSSCELFFCHQALPGTRMDHQPHPEVMLLSLSLAAYTSPGKRCRQIILDNSAGSLHWLSSKMDITF